MRPDTLKTILLAALFCLSANPAHAEVETLDQVLAAAYQNNPGLQAERAKLRATDEEVSKALSGWRPDLSATAEEGKSQQGVAGNGVAPRTSDLTPNTVGINMTQPVFSGFRTLADVHAAEADVKAQRAALEEAEQKLLLDSGKAYLDVVQAQTLLEITHENESLLQTQLAETQDRLRIGELKKTDVAQAQSRLKAATVSRLQAEGDLAEQRATFTRLVGHMPGMLAQPELTLDLPKTQDDAVALSLDKNPGVIAADYGAQAAHENIASARGSLLPAVDIVGSATHNGEQSAISPAREDTATILARLTIPLYRTGADYARTRAAEQTALQKRLELDDTRNKSRESASNAWQALVTARDAEAGRKDVVAATADALDGVKMEYKFGTRTTIDVLNAEQELYTAKTSLARADHDAALATLQLKSAIGQLTAETLHLAVKLYDPLKNYNTVRNKWVGFSDIKE